MEDKETKLQQKIDSMSEDQKYEFLRKIGMTEADIQYLQKEGYSLDSLIKENSYWLENE